MLNSMVGYFDRICGDDYDNTKYFNPLKINYFIIHTYHNEYIYIYHNSTSQHSNNYCGLHIPMNFKYIKIVSTNSLRILR